MRYSRASFVLLLFFGVGSIAYGQDKKACDLISKTDVESILGATLQPPQSVAPFRSLYDAERRDPRTGRILPSGGDPDAGCNYTNSAPGQPPPSKFITAMIEIHYSATPDPGKVDEIFNNIEAQSYEDPSPVPGLGDAAFWVGPSTRTLFVFSAGKTTLLVNGIITLDQAKALALKALGNTAKTGFLYGTPNPFTKPVLGARPAKPTPVEQLKFDLTAKADSGSAKAQFALGNFYENGIIGPDGIPKPDYPAAAYWYKLASDRGEPAASFALAQLYRDGQGMKPDDAVALRLFHKAALGGFVPAMEPLAYMYSVVKMDTSLQHATKWAEESAKAGDPKGHVFIGFLWNKGYLLPPGGNKDIGYKNAIESYQKAVALGDCIAMMNIGGLYFNGDGVPQDKNQAQSWFAKAQACSGSDLDWMRDKAAKYQQRAAGGRLPAIPTPPPGADLVKLGNSILSMMSMTLGFDVLAADSEEKLANMSLGDLLHQMATNRQSACVLSGFANNMGLPPSAC